ncbi:MAG: hypothetical protein NC829_01100, partial [Candidatus Omnitrophica bacterium]|nr:hypothetical protein [Candidatus Omnitrophota bacterium]
MLEKEFLEKFEFRENKFILKRYPRLILGGLEDLRISRQLRIPCYFKPFGSSHESLLEEMKGLEYSVYIPLSPAPDIAIIDNHYEEVLAVALAILRGKLSSRDNTLLRFDFHSDLDESFIGDLGKNPGFDALLNLVAFFDNYPDMAISAFITPLLKEKIITAIFWNRFVKPEVRPQNLIVSIDWDFILDRDIENTCRNKFKINARLKRFIPRFVNWMPACSLLVLATSPGFCNQEEVIRWSRQLVRFILQKDIIYSSSPLCDERMKELLRDRLNRKEIIWSARSGKEIKLILEIPHQGLISVVPEKIGDIEFISSRIDDLRVVVGYIQVQTFSFSSKRFLYLEQIQSGKTLFKYVKKELKPNLRPRSKWVKIMSDIYPPFGEERQGSRLYGWRLNTIKAIEDAFINLGGEVIFLDVPENHRYSEVIARKDIFEERVVSDPFRRNYACPGPEYIKGQIPELLLAEITNSSEEAFLYRFWIRDLNSSSSPTVSQIESVLNPKTTLESKFLAKFKKRDGRFYVEDYPHMILGGLQDLDISEETRITRVPNGAKREYEFKGLKKSVYLPLSKQYPDICIVDNHYEEILAVFLARIRRKLNPWDNLLVRFDFHRDLGDFDDYTLSKYPLFKEAVALVNKFERVPNLGIGSFIKPLIKSRIIKEVIWNKFTEPPNPNHKKIILSIDWDYISKESVDKERAHNLYFQEFIADLKRIRIWPGLVVMATSPGFCEQEEAIKWSKDLVMQKVVNTQASSSPLTNKELAKKIEEFYQNPTYKLTFGKTTSHGAIFVASEEIILNQVCQLIKPHFRVLDLGSGNAKAVAAFSLYAAYAKGIEQDIPLYREGKRCIKHIYTQIFERSETDIIDKDETFIAGNIELRLGDFFDEDFSTYDLIFIAWPIYHPDIAMTMKSKLKDKLGRELKKGAYFVITRGSGILQLANLNKIKLPFSNIAIEAYMKDEGTNFEVEAEDWAYVVLADTKRDSSSPLKDLEKRGYFRTYSCSSPLLLKDVWLRLKKENFEQRLRALYGLSKEEAEAKDPYLAKIGFDGKENRLGWTVANLDWLFAQWDEVEKIKADARLIRDRFKYVIFCGMGGSGLSIEVVKNTFGQKDVCIFSLRTTDPAAIAEILDEISRKDGSLKSALDKTLVIPISKSGTTPETVSHKKYFEELFAKFGINIKEHMWVITDKGSPMDTKEYPQREIQLNGKGDIGGRFTAPTTNVFLLPLALLSEERIWPILEKTRLMNNKEDFHQDIYLQLGAFLYYMAYFGKDKVTLIVPESLRSIPLWAEQLFEESLGKDGKGVTLFYGEYITPGALKSVGENDRIFVRINLGGYLAQQDLWKYLCDNGYPVFEINLEDLNEIGGLMLGLQRTVAAIGYLWDINFVNQPAVEGYKTESRKIIAALKPNEVVKMPQAEYSVSFGNLTLYYYPLIEAKILTKEEIVRELDALNLGIQDAAAIYTAILNILGRKGGYLAQEIISYGRMTPGLREIFENARCAIFNQILKLPTKLGEGPDKNHSYHQNIEAGRDMWFSLYFMPLNMKQPPALNYDENLLKAQALGTVNSLKNKGRKVVLLTANTTAQAAEAEVREFFGRIR